MTGDSGKAGFIAKVQTSKTRISKKERGTNENAKKQTT
jgi:hypothetical protein